MASDAPVVAAPGFRVRRSGGTDDDYVLVDLDTEMTPQDVKDAVSVAVNYAVGTFCVRQAKHVGRFHGGLVGDWEAVPLPQQPAAGACVGRWGVRVGGEHRAPPRD